MKDGTKENQKRVKIVTTREGFICKRVKYYVWAYDDFLQLGHCVFDTGNALLAKDYAISHAKRWDAKLAETMEL